MPYKNPEVRKKYHREYGRAYYNRTKHDPVKRERRKNAALMFYYKNRESIREKEKAKSGLRREQSMLRKYNLSIEQFNKLIQDQHNTCAICKVPFNSLSMVNIDHCHDTGVVRGLLCSPCNCSLGLVKENTDTLNNMIEYIETSVFIQPMRHGN